MINRMVWNQMAYFGAGAISVIPEELGRRGFTKAFVVTDATLVEAGIAQRVLTLLDEAGVAYTLYPHVVPNPTIQNVTASAVEVRPAESAASATISTVTEHPL